MFKLFRPRSLLPDTQAKRYDIRLRTGVSAEELAIAAKGTVQSDGHGRDTYLIHNVEGMEYRTKISTLREDFRRPNGSNGNNVRPWEKSEFMPRPDDLYQERLYAIHWMRPKKKGKTFDYEFRGVTAENLERERIVEMFISKNLDEWQAKGWLPDMRIEVGGPPRYQGLDLIRSRGWTHWHHLFNPRQLLVNGLINRYATTAQLKFGVNQAANFNSKLSRWNNGPGVDAVINTFYNQALNTIYNYGSRSSQYIANQIAVKCKTFPLPGGKTTVSCSRADTLDTLNDIFVTDPPYGDAVKYEEILEFFIAWLRKSLPPEFANWVWDSRRSLAIQGEGEDFRRGMVAAYQRMTECMSDNGIQVIQFTHQSGSIWADMANIEWASGLSVTAAWYVVIETDSALRDGSHVKGTVLLVLRKRQGTKKTTRDENVFEDADIQMAGYAAALRVLTRYAIIDGRDMTTEAIRPQVKGETTFVDGLIGFAVDTANQCLVPQGIPKNHWDKLNGAERFYLKMLDLEARGAKTLDNYQNFAKAFKVRDFQAFMASRRANQARLKSAVEFDRSDMGESSELYQSVLRAVLYAIMELTKDTDGNEVQAHLTLNIPDYYGDMTQRNLAVELADYLAKHLEELRPEEASAARVLRELVKNQRLG